MRLSVAIWKSYSESGADFVEAITDPIDLNFETIVNGGFGGCDFTVRVGGWNAVRWYRDYVGYHVIVFDDLGRRVYEGYVEATDASWEGVRVRCTGYYAHATDLTHGLLYPISTPTSISEIINDTIDLADKWWDEHSMIKTTVTDITPQDFTGEAKLLDAIEAVCKFGDDGVSPQPIYFAIWEQRRPYLFAEPVLTTAPDWRVFVKDLSPGEGLALSRSRADLFNKIQVLYDDPDIGQTFTSWKQDLVSQALFGVREGSLNIGASQAGTADVIGDLAIKAYAYPSQSSDFGITGKVYTQAGAPEWPYMVRAGSLIQVADYDPTVAQMVGGESGQDAAVAFINKTTYSASSNELRVSLGKRNVTLDLLMARLGMSAGSVT